MTKVDQIRNKLIEKLLTVRSQRLLKAFDEILESVIKEKDEVKLTKEQSEMLEMSEIDIVENKFISQSNLDKKDLEWLKK